MFARLNIQNISHFQNDTTVSRLFVHYDSESLCKEACKDILVARIIILDDELLDKLGKFNKFNMEKAQNEYNIKKYENNSGDRILRIGLAHKEIANAILKSDKLTKMINPDNLVELYTFCNNIKYFAPVLNSI